MTDDECSANCDTFTKTLTKFQSTCRASSVGLIFCSTKSNSRRLIDERYAQPHTEQGLAQKSSKSSKGIDWLQWNLSTPPRPTGYYWLSSSQEKAEVSTSASKSEDPTDWRCGNHYTMDVHSRFWKDVGEENHDKSLFELLCGTLHFTLMLFG